VQSSPLPEHVEKIHEFSLPVRNARQVCFYLENFVTYQLSRKTVTFSNMLQLQLETQHAFQIISNNMTDEEFFRFCMANKVMRIERDKDRNIIVTPPVNTDSGEQEGDAIADVKYWARKNGGRAYSSSTAFTLPNGAVRSPDTAWIHPDRFAKVPRSERSKFAAVVPDFIVEVRSKSDRLKVLKDKMVEWIENGVRLGWLIDPKTETTYIYRANGSVEVIEGFDHTLTGEDVMKGFEFELKWMRNA